MMRATTALQAIIEYQDWNTIHWGLRINHSVSKKAMLGRVVGDGFIQVERYFEHMHTGPDAQTEGSCAWDGVAGAREIWDSLAGLPTVQRGYEEAYHRYSRSKNDGKFVDSGTDPDDIPAFVLEHGLFPFNTPWAKIPLSVGAFCEALTEGPLLVGLAMHPGWSPSKLSKYGEVDDSGLKDMNPFAGHMMVAVGTNLRKERVQMVGLRQSWGPLGYLGEGLVWCTLDTIIRCSLCDPILFKPDLESLRVSETPPWW